MESVEYAVSICLRTTYNGSDCSMGSCTQKGIATPYSQLLISTAVVVFSRFSCLGITGVMRPPLNLPFLHNEGFFYQGSGELQHFKRFCFEKNIYWTDLPFHAKDDEPHNQSYCYMFMQYNVRFTKCKFTKAHPNLTTYSILFKRSRASVATHGHEMSTRSIIGNHATCSR